MLGILLVALACTLWSLDTLVRYPLVGKGVDPIVIVFYEHVILSLIFFLPYFFSLYQKIKTLTTKDVFSFFVIGGLGSAVATVAFTQAFIDINPSLVILLQKFQPVVAITLASMVLKEKIDRRFLICAGISLSGAILVSFPDLSELRNMTQLEESSGKVRGYFLVLLSVLCWGSATVFGKRLTLVGYQTQEIMAGRYFLGLVFLLPFLSYNSEAFLLPESIDYFKVLIMVLVSGALGMWVYYKGLVRLQAKTTAIAEMFFPLVAIIVNWIFLKQELNLIQILGGILLVIGSFTIQIKKY
ncbi:MAG TPA: DMT family transporter [Bacteriovoracaceae bacterium]|nr:DMT family transporter [Bacteriovoracaceae bacterium]